MKAPQVVPAAMIVAVISALCGMSSPVDARNSSSSRVDMQRVLPVILNALGAYHTALGLKEEAAKDAASATCFSRSKCDLHAALEATRTSAAQIQEEVHERQADDNRLGGSFASSAAEGLAPAIPALADWARLSHISQSSHSVRRSAQEVQSSFESTAASIKAAIQYLNYSGVPTTQLESQLEAALKGD
jgi:hypothetical protein